MKMTLNTIGAVEELIDCIEGNKKNAVINSILTKAFFSGFANQSLIEHVSHREIKKIQNRIKKMRVNYNIPNLEYNNINSSHKEKEKSIIPETIKEEYEEEYEEEEYKEKIQNRIKKEKPKKIYKEKPIIKTQVETVKIPQKKQSEEIKGKSIGDSEKVVTKKFTTQDEFEL